MKPSKIVDLSVMWAASTEIPSEVSVYECKPTNFMDHPGYVAGFYGFHARGKGLQYCALEAESRRTKFFPVTISVKLEKDISARMVTPETLPSVDMFNVARASRELIDQIAEFWYDRLTDKGWTEAQLDEINWRLTEKFMHVDESLVVELLARPEFQHLRLFVYPGMPQAHSGVVSAPISIGLTKPEFITEASSPMFPDIPIKW